MENTELNYRVKILRNIVLQLELLAIDIPYQIKMIPVRKNFSDKWLKENGFGYIIGMEEYVRIYHQPNEEKD